MTMTQVLVSFGQLNTVDVRIDIDPTLLLGSPERYYDLATEPAQKQQQELGAIVPKEGHWWFYKMLGDAATVNAEHDAFVQFVKSQP